MATAMAGLLLIGACTQLGGEPLPPVDTSVAPEDLEFGAINAGYQRAFEQSYGETPFANGALAVTAPDGLGEVVLGLAFMRMGENSRQVTMALDRAVREVRKALPPGETET